MPDLLVADLSRWQFALTAMYHFLFVPLTLGLSMILVVMEGAYVMTGKEVWRRTTKFWMNLFGINFVLGVATGITMEFQFGMNWSYYSHYVGDIFGAPLAIEGLMAFFLEATLVGLMFFGWDKLSRPAHWMVTFFVALGSNLSALWILIANGWMQNPVGSEFNPDTMRMEVTNFMEVLFNPVAQAKFVHTVSAGYVTAAVFVLGVSAWYVLKNRHLGLAKRSMAVAASFGLLSSLSVVVLGDESGYTLTDNQKMKLAALEAMWHTEEAPAPLTLIGIPDREARETHLEVQVPWVLGLIATRSLDGEVEGILPLVAIAEDRIENGVKAYDAVARLNADPDDAEARTIFETTKRDLGYGMLLLRYTDTPSTADEETIAKAAWDTVPHVAMSFYSFRLMAGLGFLFIGVFALAFYFISLRRKVPKLFLRLAVLIIPLPWIAAELGWILAETGRQPWIIDGVLPTFLGVSSLSASQVIMTMVGFTLIYGTLAVVEVSLMIKAISAGPGARLFPAGGGGSDTDELSPAAAAAPSIKFDVQEAVMTEIPLDYATLKILWWGLVGALLIGFAVTDGYDLGAASLLPFVAKTDKERRLVINSVGPTWEGHQVWLITGGGALFAAWPFVYAVSFSGFYLAMFVVLAALILRPVGFKYRSKRQSAAWRSGWDWALFVGGFVPALIFGVALGNVLQGVPFNLDSTLRASYDGGLFGLLNPFALLCGLASVAMLVMHGAAYLVAKLERGPVLDRAASFGTWAGIGVLIFYAAAGVWLMVSGMGYRIVSEIDPQAVANPLRKEVVVETGAWLANYGKYPWMIVAPVLGFAGTMLAILGLRKKTGWTIVASGLAAAGIIASVGASMFPFILPSTVNPNASLTVWDSASSQTTLFIMLIVTVIFLPIILLYTSWVFKVLWGRLGTEEANSAGAYQRRNKIMWYFSWILGLGLALTFGILNAMWNEVAMTEAGEEDLEID